MKVLVIIYKGIEVEGDEEDIIEYLKELRKLEPALRIEAFELINHASNV